MFYELIYWSGLMTDQGKFDTDLVYIERPTMEVLLSSKPPDFIEITSHDGEKRILNTHHINCLREVLVTNENPQGEVVEVPSMT